MGALRHDPWPVWRTSAFALAMKNLLTLSLLLAVAFPSTAQFPKSLKEAAGKVAGGSTSGLSNRIAKKDGFRI